MSEGFAVKEEQSRAKRACRHHWIIETPHGVTSRGACRRCGAMRRFPNAAADAIRESRGASVGRWSNGRGVARPFKMRLQYDSDEEL